MKRLTPLVLLALVVILACGGQKKPEPIYEQGSEEYTFFESLADTLGMPVLAPDNNEVLVETSEFKIWMSDIRPSLYAGLKQFASNMSQVPQQRVQQFITQNAQQVAQRELFVVAAKDKGITVPDSAVDNQMDQIYQSRGGKENFITFLEKQGFTLDYVINDVKKSLYMRKYRDEVIAPDIEVTEQELQKVYGEDKTATVRHILFMTRGKSEEEKAAVREKAQEVLEMAKAGEDFAELAKEYSEDPGSKEKGGLYESFPKGRMVKSFEEAAFNLPIGSISDLVETQYGYHIIKVIDRQKEEKPYEEVKDQLRQQIVNDRQRDAYQQELEDLKKQYNYEEHFDFLA